ncbi:uncharacterized protein J3R85_010421 [Psidium guajava]|nr:uncharacterized protein J3R85_010421 [Psidium guajava]
MGRSIRELSWNGDDRALLGESSLYATVCIIGLPIDVHIKNCSVYSGIFHAASVEGVLSKFAFSWFDLSDEPVETLRLIHGESIVQEICTGLMWRVVSIACLVFCYDVALLCWA